MRMLGGEKEGVATRSRAFRWRTVGKGGSRQESCSVYAPTTISPTSMLRARALSIGLSDYLHPVMLARTIALLVHNQATSWGMDR